MFRALESLAEQFAAGNVSSNRRDNPSVAGGDAAAAGRSNGDAAAGHRNGDAAAGRRNGDELNEIDANFAGQIATAVWIGNLSDEGAREALLSYAIACQLCDRAHLIRFREALVAEYRYCRERQDLVS